MTSCAMCFGRSLHPDGRTTRWTNCATSCMAASSLFAVSSPRMEKWFRSATTLRRTDSCYIPGHQQQKFDSHRDTQSYARCQPREATAPAPPRLRQSGSRPPPRAAAAASSLAAIARLLSLAQRSRMPLATDPLALRTPALPTRHCKDSRHLHRTPQTASRRRTTSAP